MDSRQAQKSPPSVLPRKARWNPWLWAFTNPGSVSRSTTSVSFHHGRPRCASPAGSDSEPPHDRPPDSDPGLRRAAPRLRRRPQLACGDRLRRRRRHRPDRRLARAPLARRVRVRQDRRSARRPPDDRRRRHPALARVHHGHERGNRLAALALLGRLRAGRTLPRRLPREGKARGRGGVKAVVMAGGEGTRLRPLTSNQPKPMVPVVGKPCMEHIVELLRGHGMEDVIVTVAFLPQAIRSYFGDGESLGVNIEYSVEESPLGTAGSVRLASGKLDDTFVVISGDALTDVNLQGIVDFHREKGAAVTIGLKSVENPLEFGIVVTDDEGRIERFLEKPSWGQVFSDTINTGIYVLEPEVLRHVPTDRPYDFSKELFPLLLEMGRPLYGFVFDGYWQDIGNLDQYRQANYDALDARVRLNIAGIQLRGNIWIGDGVELELDQIE